MSDAPLFVPLGENPARVFALDARTRACRLAEKAGLDCREQPERDRAALLANLDYAWDPVWLKVLRDKPGSVLTLRDQPVLAHIGMDPDRAAEAILAGKVPIGLETIDAETAEVGYDELRKKERPFVLPLSQANAERVERAAYDASYKGVTDALTLYLWRKPAFYLTRWAAEAGLSPNVVTAIGAVLMVLAFWLFWIGHYWLGILSGFVFMVLDTVDGKLARCTGTSSKWGEAFDHGIDLIHPPFWWWAWAHGLAAYGRPLEPVYEAMLLAVIVIGYIGQRIIEGLFIYYFKMHIHVWRPVDSWFRLITARRNPNMVLLVGALLFARPDVGFELVALWTLLSLIFHTVRLAQAKARIYQGRPVVSWLA
ncbi:MAG TPA: CDP-alcohol phosphatidyltransferase family protein [Sphingomicrobium sp.]|nr:CDP-alcohol phosphatidyltransferase family protein [Sphingomicrobium sp.]